jgi:AcrR family transcriptional regulator
VTTDTPDVPPTSPDTSAAAVPGTGRRAKRLATERQILEAARALVERDGVLNGLNLQEVAAEAGINRALIYQYFGSRQGLLRAALAGLSWDSSTVFHEERALPFAERRRRVFDEAIVHRAFLKLETLVALDGGEVDPFPALEATMEDLRRDQEDGALPADVDAAMAHVLTAATYLGYTAYREVFAHRLGTTAEELDARARDVFARMLAGITAPRSD